MNKLLVYIFFLFLVSLSGFALSPFSREIFLNLGVLKETIPISGTGSMYPTFPRSEGVTDEEAGNQVVSQPEMFRYPSGLNLFGKKIFFKKINYGDIIEFENEKTDKITREKYKHNSGFVKRVIALAQDKIELRDGFVYLNNNIINEPYTAKPRSTYGGDFLADCQILKIPDNFVFVLGDNRKASLDSRFELGLVNLKDINYFLPLSGQVSLKSNWRDISNDQKLSLQTTTDSAEFVKLLNQVRMQKKIPDYKLSPQLNKSSSLRGKIMLDTDDFSIEASISGLTLEKSVKQADYHNVIFAEVFSKGFYESEELLENLFEFPDTKKLLLSADYQDIGISVNLSDVKGCPTQVTVIHLGGYKPPNYPEKDIASWKELISNLTQILPSWENLKNSSVDQQKLEKLLSLLKTRLENAQKIYSRLNKNEWLTEAEKEFIKNDIILHDEAERLITELNV